MRTPVALGAFVPIALTQIAFAAGAGASVDPRDNDFAQSPAEVAAEIAAQADETPAVVAALRTYEAAQQKVTTAKANHAKAKKALAAARRTSGPAHKARVAKAAKRL